MANLYLMTQEEELEVLSFKPPKFTFDEFKDVFDELLAEFKKMGIKKNLLKKMVSKIGRAHV